MKRLVQIWNRRRRSARTLVLRFDRPRRIDELIDYFGERLAPALPRPVGPRPGVTAGRRW